MSVSSRSQAAPEPSLPESPVVPSATVGTRHAARPRIAWPHVVLSLIGMGIAAYAWYEHGVIAAGGDSGCGITETISCDAVIGSKYGTIFGLPLGAYGMIYFALVLIMSISTDTDFAARRNAVLQRLAVTTVGVCCSAALTYISVRIIGKLCPICMGTHTTTFLLFCASLFETLKLRRQARTVA